MKQKIAILLTVIIWMSLLVGCQKNATKDVAGDAGDGNKLSVVTTIFPQYDFIRQIGGDMVDAKMLLSPGSDSHSYEPTPQDIITIQNCDVFIYVGGESDEWVDDILDSVDTSEMKIIKLVDCVNLVEEDVKEGMEAEEAEVDEEEEAEYDEHVWTSPENAIKITNVINDALGELDQDNAETYKTNTENYIEDLTKLDEEFQKIVDSSKRKTIVFGDRFPLRYFVDAYGLDYWAAFPGCSTETEPSASTVAFLVDKVKEENIPVVFKIELSNGNIAESIAEAGGAKVSTFYSCHNVSKDDFDNGATYLSLMKQNVDLLKEALN